MKKVLAVAALLGLAGAAQAQVTMYGLIDISLGQNEYNGDKNVQFHSGGDNGSYQGNSTTRVGIKGSTLVAPGVKANFDFQTAGITGAGEVGGAGSAFFNRQAWGGFSGSLGEIRFGRQDSVAFQTMIGFDFNGAANAASALGQAGVAIWAPRRVANSVQYISNDMSGFKAQVGVQLKGDIAGAEDTGAIGLSYTAGPLAIAYTGESKRVVGGADFNSVAASYDLTFAKFMVGYADGGENYRGASLGVVAPVAGVNVGLMVGINDNSDKGNAYEFFVDKEIFKGTYAYFDFGTSDKPKTLNAYAAGVIITF